MKNKLLLVFTLMLCVFVSACSCNKFDIDTYTSAVKNYEDSVGLDYDLVITTTNSEKNEITSIETTNKYEFEFDTAKRVENFASTKKIYKIKTSNVTANGNPQLVSSESYYYVGSSNHFHTINPNYNLPLMPEETTYEEKFNGNSEYNLNNIVPVFEEKEISDFNIAEDKNKKGYSIATFKAACPAHLSCDVEVIEYKVTIDKNYYFSAIEYTVGNSTYAYTFNQYNNDVEVTFPNGVA